MLKVSLSQIKYSVQFFVLFLADLFLVKRVLQHKYLCTMNESMEFIDE